MWSNPMVCFVRIVDFTWRLSDCEELVGVSHRRWCEWPFDEFKCLKDNSLLFVRYFLIVKKVIFGMNWIKLFIHFIHYYFFDFKFMVYTINCLSSNVITLTITIVYCCYYCSIFYIFNLTLNDIIATINFYQRY